MPRLFYVFALRKKSYVLAFVPVGIKRYLFFALITYLFVYFQAGAQDVIYNDIVGDDIDVVHDLIVTDTGSIDFETINICKSVFVTNSGKITGDINVHAGSTLYIQSSGSVNSDFTLGDNSAVVQVVNSKKDLKNINFNVEYSLLVSAKDGVSLNQIMSMGADAKEIVFNESVLKLDALKVLRLSSITGPKIKLVGNNILYVDAVLENQPILSNVTGDGIIYMYDNSLSPLYAIQSYVKNGNVFGKIVRETDYSKILKSPMGEFLDDLRIDEPNNKLLPVMDSANNFEDLYKIMSDSVKLNPIKLIEPIRVLNDFSSLFTEGDSGYTYGVLPIFIYSDAFYTYGGKVILSPAILNDVKLSMSIYTAYTAFSDYVNDFNATTNGAELFAGYEKNLYSIDLMLGASLTHFDVGDVFDEGLIVNNPSGLSVYSYANIGRKFLLEEDLVIKPFINVGADYVKVSSQKDTDLDTGAGAEISFLYDDFDISYEYGAKIRALVSGQVGASFNMTFISDIDGLAGSIELGTLYDNDDFAYGIRAGASFDF